MDADRFDSLAKRLIAPTSRRAALGAAVAGGFLSALGVGRAAPATRAAQGGTCVIAFAAQVLQGPSTGQPLTPQGNRAGEVRGDLSFALSASGALDNATLALPDGTSLPVVGQATGHALQVRIELEPRVALVAVGVGEQEIARCQGAIDGVASGPQVGDLGDWHAAGVQQARGGGQSGGDAQAQRGSTATGGGADRSGRGGAQGQSQGTGQNASGSASRPASGSDADSCPAGQTLCSGDGECHDLNIEANNCGACGTRCPSLVCQNGRCLSEEEADSRGSTGLECDPDETICDGRCAYLSTDPSNCGACGNACDFNVASCQDGECVFRPDENCPTGQIQCGAICCAAGETCVLGECAPSGGGCLAGQTPCGESCCAAPYTCDIGIGECACPDGQSDCVGGCVDTTSNPANCGSCGIACAAGEVCSGSLCVPAGGGGCKDGSLTYCGGSCVDVNSDPFNCGACGFACAPGETCQAMTCIATAGDTAPAPPTCADQGLTDCGGVCVDVNSDPLHCGNCGNICLLGPCVGGGCEGTLPNL